MKPYDHKKIESKWQKKWRTARAYKTEENKKKPKCYVLDMFPYPSGEGLHVGHPKGYIASDIYARYKRMQGYNVLHPMGWDAFGLPAENFAIKNKVHPRKAVEKNVKRYKEQLQGIGFSYDWDREINTTDPAFYKWTQWIFLKVYEKGLAYESYEPINWCPSCQTGLANEDLEDGKCERCGSEIERKPMRQWVLKITKYADKLLKGLDKLDWPESIKDSQRNWIGRSEGVEFSIPIADTEEDIKVFTTRIDTVFGMSYVVLAPEHGLVSKLKSKITNSKEVEVYVTQANKKSDLERTELAKEKTGVRLEGIEAVNPFNGKKVPVFVADYVLGGYGTGAVMAVPAHDERDFAFSKKYGLPIVNTIQPDGLMGVGALLKGMDGKYILQQRDGNTDIRPNAIAAFGGGIEDGENEVAAALREMHEELELKLSPDELSFVAYMESINFPGKHIAILSANNVDIKNIVVHEGEGYVELSADEAFRNEKVTLFTKKALNILAGKLSGAFMNDGVLVNSGEFTGLDSKTAREKMAVWLTKEKLGKKKVNYKLRDWVFSRQRYWGEPIPLIHCAKCGTVPVPEKDLPVKLPDVKSYAPTGTGESPLADIKSWVNVRCPECKGPAKRETNTMPQWAGSSWYYLRYIDPKNKKALVDKKKEKYWSPVDLYVGGAEHATRHLIYSRFWHKFLYDTGVVHHAEPFTRLQHVGLIMAEDGRKMSKRYGNVVNPDDVVKTYGADTLRLYEMFLGPFDQSATWSTQSIIGPRRFLERVWALAARADAKAPVRGEVETLLHRTIQKVGEDIESFSFNTAISALMILTNELEKDERVLKAHVEILVQLLAPFAPHLAEELWVGLGKKGSVHKAAWPAYDKKKLVAREVTLAVQVNGKVRGVLTVSVKMGEKAVIDAALALPSIASWLAGGHVKRVIHVPGKIVNIVVTPNA